MTKRVVAAIVVLLAGSFALADWMSAGGASGSAQVTILEQSASGTTFEVSVPGVEVTPTAADGQRFSTVNLPGEVMATLEQGRPQVPKVSVLLGVPTGARVSARVLSRETRTLKVANVYPLQPPLLDDREPGPLVIDRGFYSLDASYPSADLELIHTGMWRGLATANIQVYPVKVNPARGEIEVASKLRVRVDYSGGAYPQTMADFVVPMYAEYIDNFPSIGLKPQTDYSPGVRYLVIGHDSFQANSYLNDSLLGWVKQRGFDVRTIWKSSWTDTEIKDSINEEYIRNEPKVLQFVLLVGEYGQIPMHAQAGVGRGDYWYSDLEPYSAGDNYPEIALARLSPSSNTDLDNQVKKILKYQKSPPATNTWLNKYAMVAHAELYPDKYSGCVRGIYGMPKPYWDPVTLDTIMGYYSGNSEVADAINAGRGIVAYRGHGSVTEWWAWGTEGSWYNSNIEALTNGDMTPVVYNVNCLNGDIATTECMAEKWMRKYPGGAAGTMGATQASYTYPNHGICSTLVRATTDTWRITVPGVRDYVGPYFHLSEQMMYFDAYVAKYWPAPPYPDNIYMYVTLGDPSMPVWVGGMPVAATVTRPESIPTGTYNLNVTVQAGGQPVEGALVCAWKGTEVYVSERTDASGLATLAVNAATNGPMKLTVSEGHARHSTPGVPHTPILPYEGAIIVGGGSSQAPNIVYRSNQVIDSTGNNNGMFDPGETGKIYVTIKNTGNAAGDSVTATLSSGNGEFTISDPDAAYGTIAVDSSKTNRDDPFTASAGSGIAPGTYVTCTLKVHTDNFAHDWTYTFVLRVGTPATPPQFVVDLDTGAVRLGVCAIGSIGYDEPPAFDLGSGFQVPKGGTSSLFFGSFEAGNSEDYLVDHFYGQPASSGTNHDWVAAESLTPYLPAAPADERWIGVMTDAGHNSPKGLRAEQNWYMLAAGPFNDWAVVTYDLHNDGAAEIAGLYVGYHADLDVGADPATNTANSDTVRRSMYMKQGTGENPTVGITLLEPDRFANLTAVDHNIWVYPESCLTESQKFRLLSGDIVLRNSDRNYDWSVVVSAGPMTLPVGGSERVAFAIVGSNSVAGFKTASDSAQSWYFRLLGVAEEETPLVFATADKPFFLSPNPFRTGTKVHYFTRTAGNVELTCYDAAGRAVEATTLAVKAGAGTYNWQPKELARGIYFLKVKTPDKESVAKVMLVD
jgi:hypothetical protein